MESKYCKVCNEFKPISEFHKSQKTLLCKFHHNLQSRENKKKYRQNPKNLEKEKLKSQERGLRLWINRLLSHTKKRNCENTLSINEILEIYKKQKKHYYVNFTIIKKVEKIKKNIDKTQKILKKKN